MTLAKRLALSGSRYTGSGVTLKITKAGITTLKHAKRPVTSCEQIMKKGRNDFVPTLFCFADRA